MYPPDRDRRILEGPEATVLTRWVAHLKLLRSDSGQLTGNAARIGMLTINLLVPRARYQMGPGSVSMGISARSPLVVVLIMLMLLGSLGGTFHSTSTRFGEKSPATPEVRTTRLLPLDCHGVDCRGMFQTTESIVAPLAALGTEVLSNQTFIPGYYSAASVTPASDVASGNDSVEYVGSLDAPYVAELNGSPPRLIRTMYVGGPSAAVLFDPLTGDLYALHESPGNLTVVDAETGSILANLAVGLFPGNLVLPAGLALDTANNEIFASAYSSLSIISGSSLKVIGNAWVGYDTAGVAFDAANGDLYVPNQASGNISVINGSTWKSLASISAGPQPADPDAVAVDDATNEIYVANFDITVGGLEQPGDLVVISGKNQSVVSTISLQDAGNYPWGVAVAPVSHTVYFSCATWNEIGEVSTTNYTQFRTMKWSGIPDALGVNDESGLLFSPAGWTGLSGGPGEGIVSYANATTNASLLGSVTVGASPSGLAIDPNLNELFVDDAYSGNLTVLNATSLAYMATISVGSNSESPPYYYPPVVRGVVYDPFTRLVFVANPMDRTLSVINASSRLVDHTESSAWQRTA